MGAGGSAGSGRQPDRGPPPHLDADRRPATVRLRGTPALPARDARRRGRGGGGRRQDGGGRGSPPPATATATPPANPTAPRAGGGRRPSARGKPSRERSRGPRRGGGPDPPAHGGRRPRRRPPCRPRPETRRGLFRERCGEKSTGAGGRGRRRGVRAWCRGRARAPPPPGAPSHPLGRRRGRRAGLARRPARAARVGGEKTRASGRGRWAPPLPSSLMILPQVHLRKPCYDFYFL